MRLGDGGAEEKGLDEGEKIRLYMTRTMTKDTNPAESDQLAS